MIISFSLQKVALSALNRRVITSALIPLLVPLQIRFHARSAVVVIHDRLHRQLAPTGEDDGVIVATGLLFGGRAHGVLRERTPELDRFGNHRCFPAGTRSCPSCDSLAPAAR